MSQARLYLCTPRRPDLLDFADAVLRGGVDVLQLRDKGGPEPLEAAEEIALSGELAELCHRHGALYSSNDRADIAALVDADVLHLGQDDLSPAQARTFVGPDMLIGLSTHAIAEFDRGLADESVDYLCAGPVWPTPTKPGRPAPGLDLIRHAAGADACCWFAIGGISAGRRLADVRAAGAQRIVVVRALTEAADPERAAAELAAAVRE